MVDQTFKGWNRLARWLGQLGALRLWSAAYVT
jgi:hypothetical protein